MYDYMMALQKQFTLPDECRELEKEVEEQRKALGARLGADERKELLKLTDLQAHLRDRAALNSFFSGFRLAAGVYHELAQYPPYNFDDEEENNAQREE